MEKKESTCSQSETQSSMEKRRCDDRMRDVFSEFDTSDVVHSTIQFCENAQTIDETSMTSTQDIQTPIRIIAIEDVDPGSGDAGASPMESKSSPTEATSDDVVKATAITPRVSSIENSTNNEVARDAQVVEASNGLEGGNPKGKLQGLLPVDPTGETLPIQKRLLRLLKQRESQRDVDSVNSTTEVAKEISKSKGDPSFESPVVERGDTWKKMVSCLSGCWNQKQGIGNDEEREQYKPLFDRNETEPSERSPAEVASGDRNDDRVDGVPTSHEPNGITIGVVEM